MKYFIATSGPVLHNPRTPLTTRNPLPPKLVPYPYDHRHHQRNGTPLNPVSTTLIPRTFCLKSPLPRSSTAHQRRTQLFTVRKIFLNKEFLSTEKMRLPRKWVHQDDSNDTPQPMWVEPCLNLYCGLRLAWIILIHSKGFGMAQPI